MTQPGSAYGARAAAHLEAAYPYVRAWALYHGADYAQIQSLVYEARTAGAPQDAYAYRPEQRRWVTLRELQAQARNNAVASDQLLKIYEYLDAEQRRPI